MNMKCTFGMHDWKGCKCRLCGKTRHEWCAGRDGCVKCGGLIEVATVADLQAIKNDLAGHYRLVADIDATETKNWNGGKGFAPIGNHEKPFTGVLDGDLHIIEHLSINRPGEDCVALCGHFNSGKIFNLKLVNTRVAGGVFVACLVGRNGNAWGKYGGLITNCETSGVVVGKNTVGGLVGLNGGGASGSITKCQTHAEVTGDFSVGGLVGGNSATISQCHAYCKVSGNSTVGGLAGMNSDAVIDCQSQGEASAVYFVAGLVGSFEEGTITRCQASCKVAGRFGGGLVVSVNHLMDEIAQDVPHEKPNGIITNSYWDAEIAGGRQPSNTELGGETGRRTAKEMRQRATFVGWDFEKIWQIEEGKHYPILRCFASKGVA